MSVTVHYLFSKRSGSFFSWAISKGTQLAVEFPFSDCPSHTAILINDRWVVESTFFDGFKVMPYDKWQDKNTQIAKTPYANTKTMAEIKALFRPLKGKKYDWLGVTYLAWRYFLKVFFLLPVPAQNKWHDPKKFFCCEVVAKMTQLNYEMTSPGQVMLSLLEKE